MINGALLHLTINHIPVIAAPIAFFLLAAALIFRSRDLALAGFVIVVLIGLGIYPVMKSGGAAVRMVHDLPGVTHEAIHAHAHEADETFWPTVALGVMALLGIFFTRRSNTVPMGWTLLVLLGSLGLSVWMGYVAHLGGLVRHPEIAKEFTPPAGD